MMSWGTFSTGLYLFIWMTIWFPVVHWVHIKMVLQHLPENKLLRQRNVFFTQTLWASLVYRCPRGPLGRDSLLYPEGALLWCPNPAQSKQFVVEVDSPVDSSVDSSDTGLRAVLSQSAEDSKPHPWAPFHATCRLSRETMTWEIGSFSLLNSPWRIKATGWRGRRTPSLSGSTIKTKPTSRQFFLTWFSFVLL